MKIKIFLIIGIPLLLLLAIIAFFVLPWAALFVGLPLLQNPPRPEITYGEFPFRLEYEINGQRKVIQDTLICEYDGIGINEGQGKYRKWKEHLASGNQTILLLKIDDAKEIDYDPGFAQYYMGDMDEGVTYEHGFPDARYFEKYKDGGTSDSTIGADELFEKYKIKLISWDYTQPIKNNFTPTKK